jgi:hypothetical protein
MYKIRFFGSEKCEYCLISLKLLYNIYDINQIEYFDAFADDNQNLCDNEDVEELPHVQILEDKIVIQNIIGFDNVKKFIKNKK